MSQLIDQVTTHSMQIICTLIMDGERIDQQAFAKLMADATRHFGLQSWERKRVLSNIRDQTSNLLFGLRVVLNVSIAEALGEKTLPAPHTVNSAA